MKLPPMHVDYNQIAVFRSALENPFNDWAKPHVEQGFAWRPGSVSFRTLDSGGIDVEVADETSDLAASEAVRIIAVPFLVDSSGDVELATISDSRFFHLRPGSYRLLFEHGKAGDRMWAKFTFEPAVGEERASVVRADEALTPSEPLLMEARPATP